MWIKKERASDGNVLLSERGERQISFELTTQPGDFQVRPATRVLTSPMVRAFRTALAAFPDQKIKADPRLREVSAGGGMKREQLKAWLSRQKVFREDEDGISTEERVAKNTVDLARVPPGKKWWGVETEAQTENRAQELLEEVQRDCAKGEVMALVSHSILFKELAGHPKPFPRQWGNPNGWPKNFKPYYARLKRSTQAQGGKLRLVPEKPKKATVVMVRHAHSEAQKMRTAARKRRKAAKKRKALKLKKLAMKKKHR